MASGRPSSRSQISPTAPSVSGPNDRPTLEARSRKRATASMEVGSRPRGGTAHTTSPSAAVGRRLVASTDSRGQRRSMTSSTGATASTRCSQVSSSSTRCSSARVAQTSSRQAAGSPTGRPSARAMVAPTRSSASTAARLTQQHRVVRSAATDSANRVFPAPPAPVTVTRRCRASRPRTSARSRSRPMNGVRGCGGLALTSVPSPAVRATTGASSGSGVRGSAGQG